MDLGLYIKELKEPPLCEEGEVLVIGSQAYQCVSEATWVQLLTRDQAWDFFWWGAASGLVGAVVILVVYLLGLQGLDLWRDWRYRKSIAKLYCVEMRKVKVVEW